MRLFKAHNLIVVALVLQTYFLVVAGKGVPQEVDGNKLITFITRPPVTLKKWTKLWGRECFWPKLCYDENYYKRDIIAE